MTQTDAAARTADAPDVVIRPYAGEGDVPEIARVINAEFETDGLRERTGVRDLAATFRHASESFDAARDVFVAEVDGRVAGAMWVSWIDATDGNREIRLRGGVDPVYGRWGVGRRLLDAASDRAREIAAGWTIDRPVVLGMFADEKQTGRARLLRSSGFAPVRWFFEMERPLVGPPLPDPPPLPQGLELRPVGREHARAIWEADHDAFRDHWGGWDPSEAAMHRWMDSQEFAPDLFLVAWDGDQIAGAVLNAIYADENEALGLRRGWLDSVFTRRAWRGRGLARALIVRSLHLLAQRGLDTAALGVDADNPSGALRLYESCGFVVVERGAAWQRPLEADPWT